MLRRVAAAVDAALHAWLRLPRAVRWLPVVSLVGALWWSSSRTPAPTEPHVLGALLHNAMHVVAYAVLAAAVWCAVHGPRAAVAAVTFAAAYGVIDEVHQAFVPGRVPSVWDVASDVCGALLGAWWMQQRLGAQRPGRHGVWLAVAAGASVAAATFA
jgi:VanZ family protein